jgi:cytochrome c
MILLGCSLLIGSTWAAAQDGQAAFNTACRTCHSAKAGDNRLGPTLAGVLGRKAGSVEGFAFSDSLKNSGIVWDKASLEKFIENPDSVVTGHRMKPYGGITDAALRQTIIGYLEKLQ